MICYYLPFCFGHEAVIGEGQDRGCQGIGLCIVNTDINSPNDQSSDIQFQVRFMAYDVVYIYIYIYIYIYRNKTMAIFKFKHLWTDGSNQQLNAGGRLRQCDGWYILYIKYLTIQTNQ
jgi:hypothetical protein